MQRPLRDHIAYLEQKIALMKAQSSDPHCSHAEKGQFAIDIDIAERALVYFRKAFELEMKISK